MIEATVRVNSLVENFQLAVVSAVNFMAPNKHGCHLPAVFFRFFFDGLKKLLHQADLGLFVEFVLGARVDQLNTAITEN